MQEFFIDSDGIGIHAKLELPSESVKRCPLCIVQHGLTGHMEENHIKAVAAAMRAEGIATLRTELYGHGQSGGTFAKHTLLKWVNNMLDVVDYVKTLDFVTDLYLCGHSQGGLLTVLVAALRPQEFKAILPLSPAIIIVDAARTGNMFGHAFDPEHIPDALAFDKGAVFCGDYFRIAQHIHVNEAIGAYDGPVLLVHGTADAAVPVQYSIDAAKQYKNAELVLLEGDDHGYHGRLDEACEAVRAFIRKQCQHA